MSINIRAITNKLNELALQHPVGKLQEIRTQLKKLKRQPGEKIFSTHTTFDDWAFHNGGRTELQFNIGHVDGDTNDDLRHGVAFSFQLSQTLKSIDVLVPKVKFFNDFMDLNAGEFKDMRMWHYDDGRSEDRPPGQFPPASLKRVCSFFWATDSLRRELTAKKFWMTSIGSCRCCADERRSLDVIS